MNHSMNSQAVRSLPILLLFLVLSTGCAGDHGSEVYGTVRLDGEPLTGGKITFFHPNAPGRNVTGYIQPDGSFRVLWAPRGDVTATVVALPPRRQDRDPSTARRNRIEVPDVPLKYTDPETSDLVIKIASGSQEIEIDLHR